VEAGDLGLVPILNAGPFRFEKLKGKVVAIFFFEAHKGGQWGVLQELKKYEPLGVVVIAVGKGVDRNSFTTYVTSGTSWSPKLTVYFDPTAALFKKYEIDGKGLLPPVVILDREGKVVGKVEDKWAAESDLTKSLERAGLWK
jgi:hypothetical protein